MCSTLEVNTISEHPFQFFTAPDDGHLDFEVRAASDALVMLTTGPELCNPSYQIFFGRLNNTLSVIKKNRTKPQKCIIQTPCILSACEFRGFWICWLDGVIMAGKQGQEQPFMSWTDPEPFCVKYFGIGTVCGVNGTWRLKVPSSASVAAALEAPCCTGCQMPKSGPMLWVRAAAGQVPAGAVLGGQDTSGEPLYVARARHEGANLPGKLVVSHACAYVPWGGLEHRKPEYEVLVGSPCKCKWIPASGSNVPPNALRGGESEDGEPLFIGRVNHNGSVTTGKVQRSHGVCYIPYGGKELSSLKYEILTH